MFIRLALKELKKSHHSFAHHGVVVIRGGNVVAVGFNHGDIHAEVQALRKLWPSERKGTKVVSVRMTKAGKITMAKPCPSCESFLRENGIKKVYYTDPEGAFQEMRLYA